MISKKVVTLGMLAIGGIGAAMLVSGGGSGGDTGALQGRAGRAGGILGSQKGYGAPGTVFNIPAAAAVTFPKAPTFDIGGFLEPSKKDPVKEYYRTFKGHVAPREWEVRKMLTRIGKPSPATGVQPYVYTGGKIELGAATQSPYQIKKDVQITTYMPAARLPAAIGVSTALKMGRGMAGVSAAPKPKKEPAQ